MESERPEDTDRFLRALIKADEPILIRSTCKRCGKSEIVSLFDGSLQDWESAHNCAKVGATLV